MERDSDLRVNLPAASADATPGRPLGDEDTLVGAAEAPALLLERGERARVLGPLAGFLGRGNGGGGEARHEISTEAARRQGY
jgi:hypothetical protein